MNVFASNFNNFQQQIMNYKSIINNFNISDYTETSFINSVLQVFSSLKCIQEWMNLLNMNKQKLFSNSHCLITKEFYSICFSLYNGQDVDSTNFILNYNNKYKSSYKTNKLYDDPYHFLFYLVDLIHAENNYQPNPNFNMNFLLNRTLEEKKNDDFMFNLFCSFYQQTQNSIISNNFFNIIKNEIDCPSCGKLYFYEYKYLIKFDLEKYKVFRDESAPERKMQNLTLDDCFDCFTGGVNKNCNNCQKPNSKVFCSIASAPKMLIIALLRKNHTYKCDLDFTNKLNLFGYCDSRNKNNTSYNLKACISMCGPGKYFSDILINNYWFRYYINEKKMLGDVKREIQSFEPQLLFYELEENNMFNNQNSQSLNLPNNFVRNVNQAMNNNQFNNIGFMPANNWLQIIRQQMHSYGPMQFMQNFAINQKFNQCFQ